MDVRLVTAGRYGVKTVTVNGQTRKCSGDRFSFNGNRYKIVAIRGDGTCEVRKTK